MQSYFFTKQRWLNWSLVALLVLFGFLIANHQVDTNIQHHENHHCQLFHSIGSGLIAHVAALPFIPQRIIPSTFSTIENSNPLFITVHSRAPPLFLFFNSVNSKIYNS
ncbi:MULTISPECIES: DUF2607 family protein [unclassified Aliivibrio]|uniref:DUF2607 family protein n=1 Tax=unclassified Aliivibrio TaxID=2645654 RepID=UPI00080EAD99|nr:MULTISPECIES: DUF2607 family protein [unclassified Aliivibrio]OCH11446.1 hypothetical protein A6E03_04040 [Aliivibrio sp. 1S128]OCH16807.1 hypothetical protein A6E05_15485 [Aliivibrio sp. 1S165]OCH29573.1 hypothetical protein A6E06_06005 [Aliivibrio sp. 1S175]